MRGYFLGSGVIMAILYLILAAFLIRLFGVGLTEYWSAVMLAAGVMLGGTYGIVMLVWVIAHVAHRLMKRRPIMEIED